MVEFTNVDPNVVSGPDCEAMWINIIPQANRWNVNKAGVNANPANQKNDLVSMWLYYFYFCVDDASTIPRSIQHNLRLTGQTAYHMGTSAYNTRKVKRRPAKQAFDDIYHSIIEETDIWQKWTLLGDGETMQYDGKKLKKGTTSDITIKNKIFIKRKAGLTNELSAKK